METFSRETLSPWYVTGLIDGGGVFTYSRSGRQWSLYFAIKLTEGDRLLLERIQAFFGGGGNIYRAKTGPPGAEKDRGYFRVTRQTDLQPILAHLDAFPLQTRKADAYRIWREMVLVKNAFRKPDRNRLAELAGELSRRSR